MQTMDKKQLSVEQKAHDLAVAYATYSVSQYDKYSDIDEFYQEYERAYDELLKIVKHYS